MNDFKLLAIRPLAKCNQKILKVIKTDKIYQFYNDYQFIIKVQKGIEEVEKIIHKPTIPQNLYYINKGIKGKEFSINISAIVGNNGSGKSSLIDLLIAGINNLSAYLELKTDVQIEVIPELKLELFFQSDSFYKISFNKKIHFYRQPLFTGKFEKISKEEFDYKNFFYSIIVNYSHYGLNSNEVGGWINNLFHKNDGYQTPIVLNPMRTDGNIDINSEKALTKARFIANLFSKTIVKNNELIYVTENLIFTGLKLQLKQGENKVIYEIQDTKSKSIDNITTKKKQVTKVCFIDLKTNNNLILQELNNKYPFGFEGQWETGDPIKNIAHQYLISKLVKIAVKYTFYNKYFDLNRRDFNKETLSEYINLLLHKNNNHISFKLKQTLNFLKYKHIKIVGSRSFKVDISELSDRIEGIILMNNLDIESRIELIPPPILNFDIQLETVDKPSKTVQFDSLSSGEKQLIFSSNSVLYHLINLESIKVPFIQKNYKNINIVMEEIELYFHPNLQRELISTFLTLLKEATFKRINAINICFVTHSPFILSDIPNANILRLVKGEPQPTEPTKQTFGANINDILTHDFFLTKGFMGEFVKGKINSLIEFIETGKEGKEKWEEGAAAKFIELIGEPLIKNELRELFLTKYYDEKSIDYEIERLQKIKKEREGMK